MVGTWQKVDLYNIHITINLASDRDSLWPQATLLFLFFSGRPVEEMSLTVDVTLPSSLPLRVCIHIITVQTSTSSPSEEQI